jgi:short-subunit dehydrogenase
MFRRSQEERLEDGSAYADNVVIITRSENRLRQVYREIEEKPPTNGINSE